MKWKSMSHKNQAIRGSNIFPATSRTTIIHCLLESAVVRITIRVACWVISSLAGRPRFANVENFSLNFSSLSFASGSISSILFHRCSFMVYHYHFGVFLSLQATIFMFSSIKMIFCTQPKYWIQKAATRLL